MKPGRAIIPLFLSLLPLCCIASRGITEAGILGEMAAMKTAIDRNPARVVLCREKRLGRSGFCYVIGREGTILCHPKGFLVGGSFGDNRFVMMMKEEGAGCISRRLGGEVAAVFFLPLGELGTLCCSVPAEEISGSLSCRDTE